MILKATNLTLKRRKLWKQKGKSLNKMIKLNKKDSHNLTTGEKNTLNSKTRRPLKFGIELESNESVKKTL